VCGLAPLGNDSHFFSIFRVSTDITHDLAAWWSGDSQDNGFVCAFNAVLRKQRCQMLVCPIILSGYQETAGSFV
jgi:hypothetical protein